MSCFWQHVFFFKLKKSCFCRNGSRSKKKKVPPFATTLFRGYFWKMQHFVARVHWPNFEIARKINAVFFENFKKSKNYAAMWYVFFIILFIFLLIFDLIFKIFLKKIAIFLCCKWRVLFFSYEIFNIVKLNWRFLKYSKKKIFLTSTALWETDLENNFILLYVKIFSFFQL